MTMISVYLNRPCFQYEVHSLVHAFYPDQEVRVDCDHAADPEHEDGGVSFLLSVSFVPQDHQRSLISIRLYEKGQQKKEEEDGCREEDKKETKNILKRLLYRLLSDYSGRTLPWGTLTGIRPVKIPMSLLHQGYQDDAIEEYMRSTYYTSEEKTALSIDIAHLEDSLLSQMQLARPDEKQDALKNGYSLYIGIPFCPSICLYCSFSSSPIDLWKDRVDEYLDALCHEIGAVSDFLEDRRPDTVYIGGGTPTTLTPAQMDRLLCTLEKHFDFSSVREFTVEAGRPDSITREKLAVLRSHGISRISINPQTMNQATLDFIGRKHTVEQIKEAYALALDMGFSDINMDLIVGLPGEHLQEVEHTMQEITALNPPCLTVHSLAVKRAARLRLFKEEHQELTFENSAEIMDRTAAYAQQAGLHPYYLYRQKNMAGNFENVGYAREGAEGLYNILIMEEVQSIIALGAGASTKLVWPNGRITRVENVKDINQYIGRIDEMIERKKNGLAKEEAK